jgi:release factor glutamine methyltransferase
MTAVGLHALLKQAEVRFHQQAMEGSRIASETLLEKVLGEPKINWFIQSDRLLTEREQAQFWNLMERCLNREPLQYVAGVAPFLDWDFLVNPNCLIPRPETELLVEKTLEIAKTMAPEVRILDLGTGSGNIAISLALMLEKARIVATDISNATLSVAQDNSARLKVRERIRFELSDGFESLKNEQFDVIVSNPPYLSHAEWSALAPEVQQEPERALIAGPTGLECLARIIQEAPKHLKHHGWLLLEIGWQQGQAVSELFKKMNYDSICCVPDLAGLDRVMMARINHG